MAKKDIKKVVEKEYPDFVDAVSGMALQELEARLGTLNKHRVTTQNAKDADEKLEEIKQIKSELEGPYNDTIKAVDLQSKYVVMLIKDKGGKA